MLEPRAPACCAIAVGAGLLMAGPATAQTQQPGSGQASVAVAASVPARCGLVAGNSTGAAVAALQAGVPASTSIAVDCNTPFRISVRSQQGGLVPAGLSEASLDMARQEGFATRIDYQVELQLPVLGIADGGAAGTVMASCPDARSMQAVGATCGLAMGSGLAVNAIADGRAGSLTVTIPTGSTAGPGSMGTGSALPVAGTYADTIQITIEPAG